ncbi:MAG: InlB B-repeat-containing protein, partial [Lachnospiraceae bacterium]|nr:InlB B-repeat-containing protein [Lachnospiraceae bacterium]
MKRAEKNKESMRVLFRRWLAGMLVVWMIGSVIPIDLLYVRAEALSEDEEEQNSSSVLEESGDVEDEADTEETETSKDEVLGTVESEEDDSAGKQTEEPETDRDSQEKQETQETLDSEENQEPQEPQEILDSEEPPETDETAAEESDPSEVSNSEVDSAIPSEETESSEDEEKVSEETAESLNAEEYTVILDANGGTFADGNSKITISVEKYGKIELSAYTLAEREGYQWVGWDTDSTTYDPQYQKDGVYYPYDEYEEIQNLYAIWIKSITVTLNANGGRFPDGKVVSTATADADGSYWFTFYTPKKEGQHHFLGWSEEQDAVLPQYEIYDECYLTENTTFYAVWRYNCNVVLDANGGLFPGRYGQEEWSPADSCYKELVLELSNFIPTRDGHTLSGWSENPKATTVTYKQNGSLEPKRDMTLYAIWVYDFTVTLDGNGGVFGAEKNKIVRLDAVNLSDYTPTRKNYRLTGWSTSKNGGTDYSTSHYLTVTKDTTLYAVWAKDITITLKTNGGVFPKETYSNGVTTLSSDRKTVIIKAAQGTEVYLYWDSKPTKTNAALRGWSTDKNAVEPDDGRSETLNVKATSNKTYYAVWATSCTVTLKTTGNLRFESNGKYVSSVKVSVPKGSTLYNYHPQVYVALKSGSKTSYKTIYEAYGAYGKGSDSIKWATSASTKPKNAFLAYNYKITKNVTLYAINSFTVKIKWDANGGKLDGKKSVTKTTAYAAEMYSYGTPVHSSKAFLGWSTSKKASGLVDFENPTYALKNTTYYAIWEKANKITIKGNGGLFTYSRGGTISKDKKTLTVYLQKGKSLSDISFTCMLENYTYLHDMSTTSDGKNIIDKYGYYPSGAMTLYMVGKTKSGTKYAITYKANGGKFYNGSTTLTDTVLKGESIYHSATRDGYELLGWFTKAKGGTRVRTATKKMTVYAHWEKRYKVTWKANGGSLSQGWYNATESNEFEKNEIIGARYSNKVAYSPANDKGFAGW